MPKVPYPYEVNGKLVTGNGSLIPICSLMPSLTVLLLFFTEKTIFSWTITSTKFRIRSFRIRENMWWMSTYKEAVNTVVGRFTSLIFSKVSELKKETVCPWATVRMSWSLESSMPPTGLVKSIFLISWPLEMSQNLRVLSSPHEINLRSSVLNKACLIPAVWPERSISVKYQYSAQCRLGL